MALVLGGFLAALLILAGLFERSLHVLPAATPVSPVAVAVVIVGFLATAAVLTAFGRRGLRTSFEQEPSGHDSEDSTVEPVGPGSTRSETPQDGSPRSRLRFDRRRLPLTFELAAYAVVIAVMMWPVTLHLTSGFAGWRDAQYYTWLNWRVGQLLRSGSLPLRIPDVVWPYGLDLRLIDGQLPTLIGGLWNVIAGPYLAQNLALMTGTALNLWAGRRIGRLFSDRREVWALSAVAFATAPAIAARLEVHISMYYVFPAALLAEEAVRVARGDRPIRPVILGALLLLAYLCGIYVLVFGSIAFALIVAFSIVRAAAVPATLLRGAAGVGVALVLMSPFLWARLEHDRADRTAGRETVLLHRTFIAEADALSIAAQPSTSTIDLPGAERLRRTFRENVHESTVFPGFLLLAGLAGLLLLRSRLRWPLLIAILATWLFSMGSSLKLDGKFAYTAGGGPVAWLPYTALINVPGLGALRSPNRASVTLAALLTVPFGMSAGWLFARFSGALQRGAMTAGAAVVLATNLLVPIHQGTVLGDASVHAALVDVANRAEPGESMVRIPADCETGSVLFQVLHQTPFVGCDSSTAAINWSQLTIYQTSSALAALRCNPHRLGPLTTTLTAPDFGPSELASLRSDLGIRFFLIDKMRLNDPACTRVRDDVLPVLEGFVHLGEDRRFLVIDAGSDG